MQDNRLWTVGIVNFHTADFIYYQLKILADNNPGKRFHVIIVDNSSTSEVEILKKLTENFYDVTIIDNTVKAKPWMRGSGQHGTGLDIILRNTKTEYLLVHDPDFFWVGKHYLTILESYLDGGYVCVGAPYRNTNGMDETGGIGNKDFPAAFGAAYKVSRIFDIGFMPAVDKEAFERSEGTCWLSKEGADVGWRIRERLSSERYLSFEQRLNTNLCFLGSYSYETVPYEYRLHKDDKYPIAYHLFRGSFGDDVLSLIKSGTISRSDSLTLTRNRYGRYFLYIAQSSMSYIGWKRYVSSLMVIYRRYFLGFVFIDKTLDFLVYRPVVNIATTLEKVLYVLTHPIAFISRKINKNE